MTDSNFTAVVEGKAVKEVRMMPYSTDRISRKTKIGDAALGFDFEKLFSSLSTKTIAHNFIYKAETTSTMDIVKEIQESAPNGTLVLADVQTAGKGRAGRAWSSSSGKNLHFSILMTLSDVKELMKLNLAIPLSVVQSCESSGIKGAGIKWPNDVWVSGKKLSGMLVDVSWFGTNAYANAGVGINVNEDMSTNQDVSSIATSMFNVSGTIFSREKVLADFCAHLEQNMFRTFDEVLSLYKSRDILVGKEVVVMPKRVENPERILGRAVGFSPEGYLMVLYEGSSTPQALVAEEVSIRPN